MRYLQLINKINIVRIITVIIVVITVINTSIAYHNSELGSTSKWKQASQQDSTDMLAPQHSNTTVVVTNEWAGPVGPRGNAEIVAVNPNGTLLYYNDSYMSYNDVDPVDNASHTVLYIGQKLLDTSGCDAEVCTRSEIKLLNLTTGHETKLYSYVTPGKHGSRMHDADLINETHLLVADIFADRVYIVNMSSGIIQWEWQAQSHYELSSGGSYPEDWTHLNDVEYISGKIMVSMRNHDQVIFLNQSNGVINGQTIGSDDAHGTLYQQHNPDYIPKSEGGPAVIVADSENSRIIEYQRQGDEWRQSWTWRDSELRWPRDADRLPNGHTLVTGSNSDRIVEVDENGSIVWTMSIGLPYEAERLETGDESSNGPSATQADLESRQLSSESTSPDRKTFEAAKNLLPSTLVQGLLFVFPSFIDAIDVALIMICLLFISILLFIELYMSQYSPA